MPKVLLVEDNEMNRDMLSRRLIRRSGEALAHLRHDLRTPINHILGYTEILLEDAGDTGLDEFSPALREMNAGGRQLLDWIQGALAESGSSVASTQLEVLEAKLRPRA